MKNITLKKILLVACAPIALAAAHSAHAADGQTAAASQVAAAGTEIEEIVVTATKRETKLQDTPIAISVMSGKGLADRHVTSLLDLGDGAIPSRGGN